MRPAFQDPLIKDLNRDPKIIHRLGPKSELEPNVVKLRFETKEGFRCDHFAG
jgi:hypothetical protein